MTPYFLPVGDGFRFCIFHEAKTQPAKGAVLYVPPFAEEMNKSRRMVAQQARMMAESGYSVLQIDLLGCGDSSGGTSDADWDAWQADIQFALQHLRSQCHAPITLWGVRAGCLLATQAARGFSESVDFIFWQPVFAGKQHWQQFMRLKVAGELASGKSKGLVEEMTRTLAEGGHVDIAGYSIAPGLAQGLVAANLTPPSGKVGRVIWLEVSSRDGADISPAGQQRVREWEDAGYQVDVTVVTGPSFWQTTEIEDAPELLISTINALGART